MAGKSQHERTLHFLAWVTGVIVSLVVGNAMVNGILTIPSWLGGSTTVGLGIAVVIGWIVVVTTLISAILVILKN